jgi:hypothetical protein
LKTLYTGREIESYSVYANIFATLLSILMFSTGLPALYIIGAIFFGMMYWVQKFLLIKHHSKTSSFNEVMVLRAIGYIKIGLLLHILMGCLMYTYSGIIRSFDSFDFDLNVGD